MGGGAVPSAKQFYLSPKLVGVKLIELVTYGAKSGKELGFDDDEGGYEADNSAPRNFDDNDDEPADEGTSGGSGDF